MALKIKRTSERTGVAEWAQGPLVGLKVTVSHLTPRREREIRRDASADGQFDYNKFLGLLGKEIGRGWEGFAPPMLDALVEFESDADKPQPNGDGMIPFNKDLFVALFVEAPEDLFSIPLANVSRNILRAEVLAKN